MSRRIDVDAQTRPGFDAGDALVVFGALILAAMAIGGAYLIGQGHAASECVRIVTEGG